MRRKKISKARERRPGLESVNYDLIGRALRGAPTTCPECDAGINMSQSLICMALMLALSFFGAPEIGAQTKHRSGTRPATRANSPSGPASGATLGAQSELDQLTKSLQDKYNRLTSLAADFTQVYTAPGQKMTRESGRL